MSSKCTCTGAACDAIKANACGIHFHEGTTCETATNVGGHLHTMAVKDPWNGANGAHYTYSSTN